MQEDITKSESSTPTYDAPEFHILDLSETIGQAAGSGNWGDVVF